jgi:hypothetical protein
MLKLSNTEAEVGINNDFTEQIGRNSDLRQGDSLMQTLICLVMYMIMRKFDLRSNISTGSKQVCTYASVIVITVRTKEH